MQITVEPYASADVPAMTAIWNGVVAAGQAFPQEEQETEASAAHMFASQCHCGVAKDELGRVVGLYILHPNNVGRVSHICNASYAVETSLRRQGIGEALVRDSLRIAPLLGFDILQLNAVAADNVAANKLYQKLGFKPLGQIPGGFRRPSGEKVPINLYYIELEPGSVADSSQRETRE